jgi:hypothetical protein
MIATVHPALCCHGPIAPTSEIFGSAAKGFADAQLFTAQLLPGWPLSLANNMSGIRSK